MSFNIGPPTNDTVICQLSDSDHTLHPSDLKLQAGFTYRGTKVKTYRQGKNSNIIYIAIYNIQPSFIIYENPHQHHTHFNHHLLLTTIATVIITASKATIYLLRPPLTPRIRNRYFQKQCDKQENAIDLPSNGYRVWQKLGEKKPLVNSETNFCLHVKYGNSRNGKGERINNQPT